MAKGDGKDTLPKNAMETVSFLRQQCGSLSMRGRYADCAKLIEDNLALVYETERWPENFWGFLKPYQRCYPALNRSEPFEEYVEKLLRKANIPAAFAGFYKVPPASWSGDFFRDRAVDAKTAKKPEEALDWCDLAIKTDSASSNLFLLRGWILEDLERGDDAIDAFKHSLELNDANYKASQGIARQYIKINLKKALDFIEEGISKYPEEPGFLVEKASVLLKLGKPDAALECYEKASELDPYNPEFAYHKGELLLSQDKEMSAITQFKRAIALNDKHAPSLYRMGALMENKQPSTSLEYVTTVLSMEPDNLDAAMIRARLLSKNGDISGAISQFEDILEAEPNHVAALTGIAVCCLKREANRSLEYQGREANRALEYYEKLISLEPGNPEHHIGKAGTLEILRRSPEAIGEYRSAISMDKRNHHAYYRLGMLLSETAKEEALSCILKAIAIASETAEYYAEKGRILLALGKEKEATDSFNAACGYDPGNAVYHYELGILLQRAGNRASAVKNFQEAVSLSPTMAPAHRGLAELFFYSEPENALTHINAAIQLEEVNPSHFFLKSQIVARFQEDARALEALRAGFEENKEKLSDDNCDEVGEMLQGGSFKVAMYHLTRAIELEPRNTSYLCERGHLLYRMGQKAKAQEQYQQLLKKDPNNHEALYGMGVIIASQNDKRTLEYFNKAIGLSPSTARYHAGKAAYLAQDPNKYQEAVACYDTAIPLDTWNFEPMLEKARLLDNHGDMFPAIAAYRRTLLVNPNCLEATGRLGELLCDLRPDSAFHYISHAIFLNPGDWSLRARRARILMAEGKAEASMAESSETLAMASWSAEAYYFLAKLLADKYPASAIPFIKEAAEEHPSNGEYQFLYGEICMDLGDLEGAREHFESAAALGVKGKGAQEKSVELLYRQGKPEALEAAETLPETPEGFALKARIFDEVADPPKTAEAVELLTSAVKKFPRELVLRELLLGLLRKKRSFARVLIENAKLESLRRRLEKERDAVIRVDEITFEMEQEEAAAQEKV